MAPHFRYIHVGAQQSWESRLRCYLVVQILHIFAKPISDNFEKRIYVVPVCYEWKVSFVRWDLRQ